MLKSYSKNKTHSIGQIFYTFFFIVLIPFQLSAQAPANDDCSGAITVVPVDNFNCSSPVEGSTVGATQSMPGCYGVADDDIWFKFTATSNSYFIRANCTIGVLIVMEIFSGDCGSLASMGCFYPPGLGPEWYCLTNTSITTIPGKTYYYRLYSYPDNGLRVTFNTCVIGLNTQPVELTSFKATTKRDRILLSWQTQTESNNKGFEVQYSSNGLKFDSLSFVRSSSVDGYSSSQLDYFYEYNTPVAFEKLCYRLKQVDKDGKYKYYQPDCVKIDNKKSFNIYPNPATERLNLANNKQSGLQYTITDYLGRIVRQGKIQGNLIPVQTLQPGNYVLKVLNDNSNIVFKFLKK